MVAGELVFAVGHKGGLVGAHLADEVHQVLRGVALDVVFPIGPVFHELGQVVHIAGTDMAFVGARVHRDAIGTGLQAQPGRAQHAGDTQMARVAHQRNLVDVDRQCGAVSVGKWIHMNLRKSATRNSANRWRDGAKPSLIVIAYPS